MIRKALSIGWWCVKIVCELRRAREPSWTLTPRAWRELHERDRARWN